MRRLALLAAVFTLAVAALSRSPTAQTNSGLYEACRPAKDTISALRLPKTVEVENCPIGERDITDHGVWTVLPNPGKSIYVEALTTAGSQELEVTHYRDGAVELEHVGDESKGVQSEPEIGAAASGPGECSDTAYNDADRRVNSTLSWYFNRRTTPKELTQKATLRAFCSGGASITNTRSSCHLGIAYRWGCRTRGRPLCTPSWTRAATAAATAARAWSPSADCRGACLP